MPSARPSIRPATSLAIWRAIGGPCFTTLPSDDSVAARPASVLRQRDERGGDDEPAHRVRLGVAQHARELLGLVGLRVGGGERGQHRDADVVRRIVEQRLEQLDGQRRVAIDEPDRRGGGLATLALGARGERPA